MRALTIAYILLACTVAGFTQTTATYDNVRARQQLTLNGHTLTSVLQTIDSLSTHAQGVTAKAVYDYIATKYSTVSAGTGIDVVKAGSNYTISLDTLKRLHFRTDSTYSGGVGTMRWNLTDGTLDLGLLGGNVTLQLGQESVQRVKHADNTGLVQGSVVYLVGSDGTNPTVRYARANTDLTSANTFGVMTEDATGGSKAFCTTFGLVRNINTNNLTEGGLVWLSKDTAGALTAVRPTAPNHGVEIGFCIRKHATQGVVFVTVQNGYELNELHDVYAPSPSNNQGLLWKSANLRWEAAAVDTSLNNEGRLIGFKPSNNSYYNIGSSTNGSSPIILYRGSGIGFSGTSGSPEGGDLTISNTGDLDSGNEGILGVDAGAANTSVITSNTFGATGVTVSGGTGIAVTETTSTNGGTITVTNSAPDQTVSLTNGGGVGVTGTYPSFTLTATDPSVTNEIQRLDTFSLSGQTLHASLLNDGVAASTVTLPIIDVVAGANVTVAKSNGVATVSATGSGTVTGTGVAGRAAFWHSTSAISSDANFAWDSTNVQFNIGTPLSPTGRLNVRGGGTLTTVNLRLTNSGNTELLKVLDNGNTNIGTNFSWDNSNNRLNIGNLASPAATLNVKGAGNTLASGNAANIANSDNKSILRARNDGVVLFGNTSAIQWFAIADAGGGANTIDGTNFSLYSATTSQAASWGRLHIGGEVHTQTSGDVVHMYLYDRFSPISGTATTSTLRLNTQINQTGGANGITRGIYLTPLLTSAADWRSIEWSNNSGFGLYGVGTANNYLAGNTAIGTITPSARLHVQGGNNTSNTYSLIVTNSGGSTTTPAICAQNDQKVGIGTNSVDSGATLEVDGTSGGILFPRLTTTQRDALTPTNGLVIYNSTTDKLQVRAGGAWVDLH